MILDLIYVSNISLILFIITIVWNFKSKAWRYKSVKYSAIVYLSLFFNVWGLDVIQREFNLDSLFSSMKLSLGCWLVFSAPTNVRQVLDNGWSLKEFWLNYGGDLINFIIAGVLLHFLT